MVNDNQATIENMIEQISELKQQAADREAHVRNLIDSETLLFNYLADIRQAVGDDGRLMLPGLVEHIRGMSQQLIAAGITAANCELFRKDAERAYIQGLKDQKGNFEKAYSSTDCWTMCENKTSDGLRAMDAAIDAARSTTDNTTEQPT